MPDTATLPPDWSEIESHDRYRNATPEQQQAYRNRWMLELHAAGKAGLIEGYSPDALLELAREHGMFGEHRTMAVPEARDVKDAVAEGGRKSMQALGSGTAALVGGLEKAPGLVYDLAAIPQNFAAEALNIPSLKVSAKQVPGLKQLDQAADDLLDYAEAIAPEREPGTILDSFKQKDLIGAGEKLGLSVLENLPQLAGQIGLTLVGAPQAGLGMMGASSAGQKYHEVADNADMSDTAKKLNAVGTGLAEVLFERWGTQGLIEKALAAKGGEELLKFGLRDGAKKILAAVGVEATEEAQTQLTENLFDITTGNEKKIGNIFDGVFDAALVGGVMGGGMGSVDVAVTAEAAKSLAHQDRSRSGSETEAPSSEPAPRIAEAEQAQQAEKASKEFARHYVQTETEATGLLEAVNSKRSPETALPEGSYLIAEPKSRETRLAAKVAKYLGLEAVFVTPASAEAGFFNGSIVDGVIYLNTAPGGDPALVTVGHEFGHYLKTTDRAAHDSFVKLLTDSSDTLSDKYRAYIDRLTSQYAESGADLNEEFASDVMGDLFGDADFWRELSARDQTLARRLADMVVRFVEQVKTRLKGERDATGFLKDLDAIRSRAAEIAAGQMQAVEQNRQLEKSREKRARQARWEQDTSTPTTRARALIREEGGVKVDMEELSGISPYYRGSGLTYDQAIALIAAEEPSLLGPDADPEDLVRILQGDGRLDSPAKLEREEADYWEQQRQAASLRPSSPNPLADSEPDDVPFSRRKSLTSAETGATVRHEQETEKQGPQEALYLSYRGMPARSGSGAGRNSRVPRRKKIDFSVRSRYRENLARIGSLKVGGLRLSTPSEAAQLLHDLHNPSQERLTFVPVAKDGTVGKTGVVVLTMGTVSSSPFDIKQLFKAMRHTGADRFMLVHNHPGGDPTPSQGDIATTKAVRKAMRDIGRPDALADHIVLGNWQAYSFAEGGKHSYIPEPGDNNVPISIMGEFGGDTDTMVDPVTGRQDTHLSSPMVIDPETATRTIRTVLQQTPEGELLPSYTVLGLDNRMRVVSVQTSPMDQFDAATIAAETLAQPGVAKTVLGVVGDAADPDFRDRVQAVAEPLTAMREGFLDVIVMDSALLKHRSMRETGQIRFSMAGERARTMDSPALARATTMEEAGADSEAVRKETGWFRGLDGIWRFEIDDSRARLKTPDWTITEKSGRFFVRRKGVDRGVFPDRDSAERFRGEQTARFTLRGKLADLLDHPELFKAYPELGRVPAEIRVGRHLPFKGVYGHDRAPLPDLQVSAPTPDTARIVLLHELQHAIQRREGFAKGGSPAMFRKHNYTLEALNDARVLHELQQGRPDLQGYRIIDELFPKRIGRRPAPGAAGAFDRLSLEAIQAELAAGTPERRYRRLAGEIEARNVEVRSGFSPEIRRNIRPDIDREDADVRFSLNASRQSLRSPEQMARFVNLLEKPDLEPARPDLANPAESKEGRKLMDAVDQLRLENGLPARQTVAEWEAEADARLTGNEDRVWQDLAEGRLAMDDPVNTLMAKRLLESKGSEAVRTMDADALKTAMLAAQAYRSGRSAIARAMRAGFDPLKSRLDQVRALINGAFLDPGRMKPGDADKILPRKIGQLRKLKARLKKRGIDLDNLTEADVDTPQKAAALVREIQAAKASKGDKAYEWWINVLLSMPTTHAANMLGNSVFAVGELTLQRFTEASINLLARRKEAASFGEFRHMAGALKGNVRQAFRNGALAFELERPVVGGTQKLEGGNAAAIAGKPGRIIRAPGRLLLWADEIAKSLIVPIEASAYAYRQAKAEGLTGQALENRVAELAGDQDGDAVAWATNRALELTFQAKPGQFVQHLLNARNAGGPLGTVAKYALPFLTTPANIILTTVRKSPLGAANLAYNAAAGNYKGDANRAVHHAAEQLLAWGALMALHSLMGDDDEEPWITGSRPSYKERGKYAFKMQNLPPTSIRIGDRWFSYNRIEPMAGALTMMVDSLQAFRDAKDGKEGGKIAKDMLNSAVQNVRDKTFLQTVGDIVRATEDPDTGGRLATNFLASWVPNAVRASLRGFDDKIRESRNYERGLSYWQNQFGGKVLEKAGLVRPLPKVDLWGRDIDKRENFGSHATDIAFRLVSPVYTAKPGDMADADRLIWNYNRANPNDQYWPTVPSPRRTVSGKTQWMTADQHYRYTVRAGQLARAKVDELIRDGRLNPDSPGQRDAKILKKVFSRSRLRAKRELFD